MQWRTQDWCWLLAFWIYATVFSFIYKDLIMTVISYVSTFVSIALAGVAMFISLKQISQNDNLVGEMHRTLGSMNEKLSQVDTKISKIDAQGINRDIENDMSKIKEELRNEILKSIEDSNGRSSEQITETVNDRIEQKFKELNDRIKTSVNERINTIPSDRDDREDFYFREAIKVLQEREFTIRDVMDELLKIQGYASEQWVHSKLRRLIAIKRVNRFVSADGVPKYKVINFFD